MIGLIALLIAGGLLVLAIWAFLWTYRAKRRHGKSEAVSIVWAVGAVFVLSLPITWDAIPTWIAFEYYAHKEAGVKVFKTLEQWKAENPGVAKTLKLYGLSDKPAATARFSNGKSRYLMNARIAHQSQSVDRLFLTVYARRYSLVDVKDEQPLIEYVEVGSGNDGGLATGGSGWWAFWLIHRPTKIGVVAWSEYVAAVRKSEEKHE